MINTTQKIDRLDVIILAGGLGTRLRSVVSDRPKVLALVNGKPFIRILLDKLNTSDAVRHVVIATGYMADMVIEACGSGEGYSFQISYSIEEQLLGTGGGLKNALDFTHSQEVLALNGDSFVDFDVKELICHHWRCKALLSVVLTQVENASRYGRMKVDDRLRILGFEEKAQNVLPGMINAGVYLFDRKIFDKVEKNRKISFENQLLPALIQKGAYGYISRGKFIDIGVPEAYMQAAEYLKGV